MARNTEQLVTCREIADILMGNPSAEDLIVRDMTDRGATILRDWADRPCISLSDATRLVGADLKKQRENYEAYLRDRELDMQVANAQQNRERTVGKYFHDAMRSRMGSAQDISEATAIARKRIQDEERSLPLAVRKRLYWNIAIENTFGQD